MSVILLIGCVRNETANEHDTYTCPMHPTVISDRPGTCPVCGMDLVRKARAGEEVEITEDLSKLLKSPNEAVVASIKTIKGEYKSVQDSVQAQGIVTYDTRYIYTISARVGGRLEKNYLNSDFEPVSKGQKIAEIYSPELLTAQKELLFLLENDPENAPLIMGAQRKLELLGLTDSQINTLKKVKAPANTFSIYSPYSGYLITDRQSAPTPPGAISSAQGPAGGGMTDGMGPASSRKTERSSATQNNTSAPLLKEGDYVTPGQKLFTIVNANALRIELDLPGAYVGRVPEGTAVRLNLGGGQGATAAVDFVQPFFGEGQDFLKIRLYTKSTERLSIGQLVSATVSLAATESLWVPRESVLDLGIQKVVFLRERGVFKPKQVTTGISTGGLTEIRSGLASQDEIAANAQYLVDSESFVRVEK